MARCEDFPCCGHELGCCPDYDSSGKQLNMKCTCGATLPIGRKSSICDTCLQDTLKCNDLYSCNPERETFDDFED